MPAARVPRTTPFWLCEYFRERLAKTVALLLLITAALPAAARSWSISDFQDTVQIARDGAATVTEQITCVFAGEYHGIYRRIPVEYPGRHGGNYTLYLEVTRISDDQGNTLKYELSNHGAYRQIKIYIPNATDTSRTVNLTYSVRNALRYFDDYDEFYWNVTGNDWPVPIEHAAATVMLPAQAAGAGLRAQAFTGVYGEQGREASAKINGAEANFESTNPLALGGGMTIDVYLPKGVVTEPGALVRLGWFLGSNPIVFLPLFALLVMFTLWYRKGRDPAAGISVAPMYSPPENLSPAEAGALLGDRVHPRDLSATLVDLAVKGYLRIEQTGEQRAFMNTSDYNFHLLKPRPEWQQLLPHERIMLEGIFFIGNAGDVRSLSSLRNQYYQTLPEIKDAIIAALDEKGMYGLDPSHAAGYDLLGAIVIAAPFILLQWFGIVNFALAGWLVPVSVLLAAAIAIFFFRIMPAKSLRGARAVVGLRGFQEFMSRVEKDRLQAMPPETFEKFLPYAMALGVEERWAHAFAGLARQQPAPAWYAAQQPGMFNPIFFTHSINTMAMAASQAFVSSPRASAGGSGFGGGGGFSGGGFGGGGGDAF